MDGIVTAQEAIHSLQTKRVKGMMMKLDLAKAYDRISWSYLLVVIKSFGFDQHWLQWLFSFISTPNFTIIVNGIPSQPFNISRGLHQGDPLSPFLFIIAAEGLCRLLKASLSERQLHGLKLWGPTIALTHQQFVDDILLFCEASVCEIRIILAILDIFMEALGTLVNKDKSHVYFFNINNACQQYLARLLGFHIGSFPMRYLGVPLCKTQLRVADWHDLIIKMEQKLQNWAFQVLNAPGRLILLKSILQSIPIYQLLGRAALKSICNQLVSLFTKFLWQGLQNNRKWPLVSWQTLIKSKSAGGLGLHDPLLLNQVMGAKLWWKWLQGGNDLWKTLWETKYEMPHSIAAKLKIDVVPKGSTIWNLAAGNRFLIRQHSFWEVRDGTIVLFLEDSWKQREKLFTRLDLAKLFLFTNIPHHRFVSNYWTQHQMTHWRKWKGKAAWPDAPDTMQWRNYDREMQTRKINVKTRPKILRWGHRTKGMFTFNEDYHIQGHNYHDQVSPVWKKIWGMFH